MNLRKIYLPFLMLFATWQVFAEVRIQTLDSWQIQSFSPDALLVRKGSEITDSYLAIEVSRPFCICENLSIVRYEDNDLKEDQEIEGKLSFNFLRSKRVTYRVKHADKDWYVLSLVDFPSIRNTEHLSIESEFFKDSYVITGLDHVMKQSTKMCESFIEYERIEPKEIKL